MPTNVDDLLQKLTPARRKKVEARAAQLIAEERARRAPKSIRVRAPKAPQVTAGSGNVFADLGLANPQQKLEKARLMLRIYRAIKGRELTRAQVGEILGVRQAEVASLMDGKPMEYPVKRLRTFLAAIEAC